MILNMFVYHDKKLGSYSLPVFDSKPVENFKEELLRAIKLGAKIPAQMREVDLYHIGTFNDKTCKCSLHEPEFLLSISEHITKENIQDEQSA